MDHVDVLIVGAGPAGATASLNLAPSRSVLLIDCRALSPAQPAVGESLVPAAGRLFRDMGLMDSFLVEGHEPWYGNRSVWGSDRAVESDLLRDPDGHGWHLDRLRFDGWLRAAALDRGSRLMSSTTVLSVSPEGQGWRVSLSNATTLGVHVLIDATGSFATLARRLGAQRQSFENRMACYWLHGTARETSGTAGFTFVEAVEAGWWYSAPLPGERRVLAFHTDADLPASRLLRSPESLVRHSGSTVLLRELLIDCRFSPDSKNLQAKLASGGTLSPAAGRFWFAAGDAAVHFDPLSSQGLFNALFTGLAAAEAADRLLQGEEPAIVADGYCRLIEGIRKSYQSHLALWYAMENRWPASPFWARRNDACA
jgi:flavin-dependent dehydrogenase